MLYASADNKALIERAKELGQPAVAMTDYGNVYEAINFYRMASAEGIKPILGATLFFCEDAAELRVQKARNFNHIVLLAENDIGWKNITRLISHSNDPDHFFYNPRIDFELLEKYNEGIIVLTGNTRDGIIPSLLFDRTDEHGEVMGKAAPFRAEALVRRFLKIFDTDRFFLEVQDTDDPVQKEVNDRLRTIAAKYSLTTLATNNVHYVNPADAESHRTLLSMENNKYNKLTRTNFDAEEYYLKSREDILESEILLLTELDATLEVASRCQVNIDLKKHRLPKYKFVPEGKTSMEYLRELTSDGLAKIFPIDKYDETYEARLDRELADIEDMGFADYFLIVHDVINYCHKNDILMGYGRGSVGGSLVSYVLGITNIDPLQYGLIWERFLNKGRGGLPDIDTDVPKSRRQEVLEYIRERFGRSNVAQIVNYNSLKAKAVLKEVFRTYDMDFEEANKITACVPGKNDDHTDPTLEEALVLSPELRKYEQKYPAWFKIASDLEGCYKTTGIHAAAVVISDTAFEDSPYPLARSKDGDLIFGWDMDTVDTLHLLKLDILGLSTLDDIDVCRKLVNKRRGLNITRETMPLTDGATFAMLAQGFTIGVFQIEKQLGRIWSKNIEPESIEELSDLVSIIRPGPMESDMHTKYKGVKFGEDKPTYIHSALKPIMSKTKSSLLYQEQVIEICKQLAGLSLIDADKVRKAMGKKKPEEMKKWKAVFVDGCVANGIAASTAAKIWGYVDKFAGYGFNKSHGVGYALLAYETAYLKANYTLEFICAKLRHAKDMPDKFERMSALLYDAKLFGIEVTPPLVQQPGNTVAEIIDFSITDDTHIAFGLTALKGVGDAAARRSISFAKKAGDFDEFLKETIGAKPGVSTTVVDALIKSGAFGDLGEHRVRMLARYRLFQFLTEKEKVIAFDLAERESLSGPEWTRVVRGMSDDKKIDEIKEHYGIKRPPNIARRQKLREALQVHDGVNLFDNTMQNIVWEKFYLGVSLSGSEADVFKARDKCVDLIKSGEPNTAFEIAVCLDSVRVILTKTKGEPMAFVTGRDKTFSLDGIVVFPQIFKRCEGLLEEGNVVKVCGKINDRGSYIAEKIERLS
jgi:DNA polymerase-3 subunit alpha